MQYYSTRNKNKLISFKDAVVKGLAEDKGLYFPEQIPILDPQFFEDLDKLSLSEIAFKVSKLFIGDEIDAITLEKICNESLNFEIPTVEVTDKIYSLELFHGPTCAFKDVGARFMARCFSHFVKNMGQKVTILVATSGDTGSAVANGFYEVDNLDVVVLYPSGKVSEIQEKQFTTPGKNITALEVDGTFDDCQALVKEAFMDDYLKSKMMLSSANSINIARLIPQSFYYFYAYAQLKNKGKDIYVCVPSGNYGNITAGLFAKEMGLPIKKFVAASNANKIVPDYLKTGNYEPKSSIQTIANAMDVGDPSNFERIITLYKSHSTICNHIEAYSFIDNQIKSTMQRVYKDYSYTLDPHGATGFAAIEEFLKKNDGIGVFLETAHPVKFLDVVEETLNHKVEIPQRLKDFMKKEKKSIKISKDYQGFKNFLINKNNED